MERMKASDFPQEVLNLFDRYVHGGIDRRQFLDKASKYAVGGMTAAAMLEALRPNFVLGEQIQPTDNRIKGEEATRSVATGQRQRQGLSGSPGECERQTARDIGHSRESRPESAHPRYRAPPGRGQLRCIRARCVDASRRLSGQRTRGQTGRSSRPDVRKARWREENGRLHRRRGMDQGPCREHRQAGLCRFLFRRRRGESAGGQLGDGAEPRAFHSTARRLQRPTSAKIKAHMLINYAAMDDRINAGWPAYEAALKANKVRLPAIHLCRRAAWIQQRHDALGMMKPPAKDRMAAHGRLVQ